jgi:uncharacterized membrane protein YhhN
MSNSEYRYASGRIRFASRIKLTSVVFRCSFSLGGVVLMIYFYQTFDWGITLLRYFVASLYLLDVALHLFACVPPERHVLRKITKCLLMPLLALSYRFFAADFSVLVFLALMFGFAGDAFLLAPNWTWSFGAGLASFAVGHIFYIIYMLRSLPAFPGWYTFAILAFVCFGAAAFYLRLLQKGLPKALRIPGFCYAADIVFMAGCAFLFAFSGVSPVGWLAPVGGMLFVASDTALSADTFLKPVPYRYLVVMGTYIAAQTLITTALAFA